jgi:outer membrane receptor protein involved in Fe transport
MRSLRSSWPPLSAVAGSMLVAAGLSAAPIAAAVQPPKPDLTRIGLEALLDMTIQTASKQSQRMSEAPATVTVITRDEIREHGFRTLGDVMRTVPGLHVSNDRNYEYLGVRGFSRPNDYNTRVLLLIDGRRINDIVYDSATFDRSFPLDLSLIERIEFVPGPGSALYGANAFFGVLNVITRTAASLDGVTVNAGAGSFGTIEGGASIGRRYDSGLDVLLAASGLRSRGADLYFPEFDAPATNQGRAVGLDGERSRKLHLNLGWKDWRLTGSFSDREKQSPTAPFGSAFNVAGTRTVDSYAFLSLRHELRPAEGLSLSTQINHSTYRSQGWYVQDTAAPGATGLNSNRDDTQAHWWGLDMRLNETRIAGHHWVLGLELEQSTRLRQRNSDDNPFFSYLDSSRHLRRTGVYLQDSIRLGEKVTVTAGLRHDHHSTSGGITTPRLGLVYRHSAATTVKLMAGNAYRAANAYELDYAAGSSYEAAGNLRPERISTLEAALEQSMPGNAQLRVAVFRYRLRDLIEQITDPVSGLLHFANVQSAQAQGLTTEWQQFWASGARLRTSLTWQQAVNSDSGQILSNSPRLLAKLTGAVPLPTAGATLALDAQYIGRRNTESAGGAAGYAIANLTVSSRQLIDGVLLSASVYNLFDRRFADVGSAEFRQTLLPQDGRTLWARASRQWH